MDVYKKVYQEQLNASRWNVAQMLIIGSLEDTHVTQRQTDTSAQAVSRAKASS